MPSDNAVPMVKPAWMSPIETRQARADYYFLDGQREWYSKGARKQKRRYLAFAICVIALGALISLLQVLETAGGLPVAPLPVDPGKNPKGFDIDLGPEARYLWVARDDQLRRHDLDTGALQSARSVSQLRRVASDRQSGAWFATRNTLRRLDPMGDVAVTQTSFPSPSEPIRVLEADPLDASITPGSLLASGPHTLRATIADFEGNPSTPDEVSFTVGGPANQDPIAGDDSATTTAGTPVDIAVLANDSDPDKDPLAISAFTQGTNGTVAQNGNLLTYTPAAGFTGTDSFTYTISDGRDGTDTATASVTVDPPPLTNEPPSVDAGPGSTVILPDTATLDGTVTDDGLPNPPSLTTLWSTDSGPGPVVFGNATAVDTTASFTADGTYILRLTANDGALSASDTVTITVAPGVTMTSFELIEKALADGIIDAETALVYKVYVDFNDDRLPAQYKGRNDASGDASSFLNAQAVFHTLSPATQELLAPFLLLPTEPGSWLELQASRQGAKSSNIMLAAFAGGTPLPAVMSDASQTLVLAAATTPAIEWSTINTANGKVKIWWMTTRRPQDEARAMAFRDELDRYLWTKLTILMKREPLKDHQLELPDGTMEALSSNGGSPSLDIYLTSMSRPVTKPYTKFEAGGKQVCNGKPAPTAILFGQYDTNTDLAHELMHAILHGYQLKTCFEPEYRWMHEATARWAEHFAYPLLNNEHGGPGRRGASFLDSPYISLNHKNDDHEYGAYLWFFYLGSKDNLGAYVRETWEAAAGTDSLSAIQAAIGSLGGFMEAWPQFVLYNWNRVAVADKPYRYYFQWDKLDVGATEGVTEAASLFGKASHTYSLAHKIPHLAARYFHYDFTADNAIRSLTFTHPYADGSKPTAKVQAIVKIRDQEWKPAEPWGLVILLYTLCKLPGPGKYFGW